MISLHPYQEQAKNEIANHFKNGRKRVLLQMPTGAGKTRTFCSLISDRFIENKQFRCILVAHVDELLRQIGATLGDYGIEYGVIKAEIERDLTFQVQVASIGTLRNELGLDGTADLIVIDEAHHTGAASYNELFQRFPNAFFIGATATPCRMDGKILANFFDEIVIGPSIKELINDHKLAPVKILRPQHEIEGIEKVKITGNDYDETELGVFMNKPEIRAKLVQSYLTHCYGKKGIVYAVGRNHAIQICQDYLDRGIDATYIVSNDPSGEEKERIARINAFKTGKIKILVNVGIFTEGFDCPDADFVQLARPTKSLILYLQQVGRALRTNQKKKFATILDNAGLTLEHGSFIHNEYDWDHIFKYGLGTDAFIKDGNGGNMDFLQEESRGIQEGEEDLIAEIYGLVEDEEIIEFFSESLRNLYNHIKGIQLINGAGYLSESAIGAVKELEPVLYTIADKNFQFFKLINSSIDLFQIELTAYTFEKKRLQEIINEVKLFETDPELKELINAIRIVKKSGIELSDQEVSVIQNKVKLSKSNVEQLLKGDFDAGKIYNEIATGEIKSKELEENISELNERLLKIKEFAHKGLIAEEEFYKSLEIGEESILLTKVEESGEINFNSFTLQSVNLLLSDHTITNNNIIKEAFRKVLKEGETAIPSEMEKLFKDPLVYYNVAGMGRHKAKIIRDLIEYYGKIDRQKVTIDTINKQFKAQVEYTNDLQFLSKLIFSNLNLIQQKIIASNSTYNLFQFENDLTLEEISKELNENINTVKGSARRLDDGRVTEKFEQCPKIFKEETIKELLNYIKETEFEGSWVFDKRSLEFLNQKYGVNFSIRGYSKIFSGIKNQSKSVYFNEKLKNLYFIKGHPSTAFEETVEEVLKPNVPNSKSLSTSGLTNLEQSLLKVIILTEFEIFRIDPIENGIKIIFKENDLGKKEKIVEALKQLGTWSTSAQIFEKCEDLYPGDFPDANTISSDYLSKLKEDFKGETEKKLKGKKYGLSEWLISGFNISKIDLMTEMENFDSFKMTGGNKLFNDSDFDTLSSLKSIFRSDLAVSSYDIDKFKKLLKVQEFKNGYKIQNSKFITK